VKPVPHLTHAPALDAQLRALARRIVADGSLAEDAVQDTWVSVLSRGLAGRVSASWLRGALRNRAKMRLRADERRRRREAAAPRRTEDTEGTEVTKRLEQRELLVRLREALAGLPEPEQTIVRRRWLEEQTSSVIADELGLAPATVRWHLARAMKRLRVSVGDDRGTSRSWLAVCGFGPSSSMVRPFTALAVVTAVVVVGPAHCDREPRPSARPGSLITKQTTNTMPKHRKTPIRIASAVLSTACVAGCVEAPETAAPEPRMASHDRVVLANEPRASTAGEVPAERCTDLCTLSLTPRLRVDCSGVAEFDACAEQCAVASCPAGDLSFTAEDVGTIGTAGCDSLWCPTGCDDAVAWGQCVSDCATEASREAHDDTCDFAGTQSLLCDLECRAAEPHGAL